MINAPAWDPSSDPDRVHAFVAESNKIDVETGFDGRVVPGAAPGDLMYDNHLAALDMAVDRMRSERSRRTIMLDIHGELFRGVGKVEDNGTRGRYRTAQDMVEIHDPFTGRVEVPPAHYLVRPLIEETLVPRLDEWLLEGDAAGRRYSNKCRAWWLHNFYECVHGFSDGNGRSGRILMAAFLIALGQPPIVVYKGQMKAYFARIQRFRAREFGDHLVPKGGSSWPV